VHTLCTLATQEAKTRGLALRKIEIRPAWAYESEQQSEIVIDVEILSTTDAQFAYWDAVYERIHQLEATLSQENSAFSMMPFSSSSIGARRALCCQRLSHLRHLAR
jgi:hypothetical protein